LESRKELYKKVYWNHRTNFYWFFKECEWCFHSSKKENDEGEIFVDWYFQ